MQDSINRESKYQKMLEVPENVKPEHHRTFYVASVASPVAFLLHFSWLCIFWWFKVMPLFYFNIASSLYWVFIFFLVRKKGMVLTAMILNSVEVLSHQILAVYILGWDYGFQYFFFLPAFFIFLGYFNTLLIPFGISVLSLCFYLLSYYHTQHLISHVILPSVVQDIFYFTNLVSIFFLLVLFSFLYSYAARKAESGLEKERQKSENLLLNILPHSIAQRLKDDQSIIADHFDSTSVLFADIVGFTKMSEKLAPTELVKLLNLIFSSFDDLVEKYKLEKIKTVGDAYMVAGGFPVPRHDHTEAIADLALEMRNNLKEFHEKSGQALDIRVGIHTGPAVAGVIGIKKFIYDVWGDTVNTASRMESHGIPGQIQVSEQTYEELRNKFLLKERGVIEIKGKGKMKTYLLQRKK
jgi:class 3 adenylate cyclase